MLSNNHLHNLETRFTSNSFSKENLPEQQQRACSGLGSCRTEFFHSRIKLFHSVLFEINFMTILKTGFHEIFNNKKIRAPTSPPSPFTPFRQSQNCRKGGGGEGRGYKGTELGRATFFSPRKGKGTRVHLGLGGDPPPHSYEQVGGRGWLFVLLSSFKLPACLAVQGLYRLGLYRFALADFGNSLVNP